MTLRAAIFDLDGTLVDTLGTIARAANFALRSLALPEHPVDAYRRFVGDGVHVLARRVLPAGRQDLQPDLVRRLLARYESHVIDGASIYPGVRELLEKLRDRGLRLGVLSNKPDFLTFRTLEGLALLPLFDAFLGQRDELPRKPDAAVVELLLTHWPGVPRDAVLYVGDTSTDMQTARNAALRPIGVLWGFRDEQELRAHGAAAIARRPEDVAALLDAVVPATGNG